MDPRYKSPTANVDIQIDVDEDFRDLEQLTSTLRWMLLIGALLALVSAGSAVMSANMLANFFSFENARTTAERETAIRGLTLIYALATMIVFARWILLAHRNLPALGARYVEVTPGWALGWFFIPVVHVWFPFRAMRFLWRSSHSTQRPDIQDDTWLLPAWWALWLTFIHLPLILAIALTQSRSLETTATVASWFVVERLVNALSYIVASLLVVRVWNAQHAQHANPHEYDPAPGFADGTI